MESSRDEIELDKTATLHLSPHAPLFQMQEGSSQIEDDQESMSTATTSRQSCSLRIDENVNQLEINHTITDIIEPPAEVKINMRHDENLENIKIEKSHSRFKVSESGRCDNKVKTSNKKSRKRSLLTRLYQNNSHINILFALNLTLVVILLIVVAINLTFIGNEINLISKLVSYSFFIQVQFKRNILDNGKFDSEM